MARIRPHDFIPVPEPSPELAGDEIHVWRLLLDGEPKPREVTQRAHAVLRGLLARYAGLDREPDIARGEHGKPYAPALPELEFNLSHAREHVVLAFARRQPLGIDVERVDRRLALDDLARRFFAPEEADALDRVAPAERALAFLRLWTCKEAVLKAIGAGLSFGLDRAVFALDGDGAPETLIRIAAEAGPREGWNVARLDPAAGCVGALAWRGRPMRVRAFDLATTPDVQSRPPVG